MMKFHLFPTASTTFKTKPREARAFLQYTSISITYTNSYEQVFMRHGNSFSALPLCVDCRVSGILYILLFCMLSPMNSEVDTEMNDTSCAVLIGDY